MNHMDSKNSIPIFYACDDNFVKYTMVSIKSMMENAAKDCRYTIHILSTDICEERKQLIQEMAADNFEIHFEDMAGCLKSIDDKLPLRDYYSKTTYYRLYIAELFQEYDKAIYIDSDTIVLDDIAKLYEQELGACYIGAAQEQVMIQEDIYGTYVEKVLGIDRNQFFNAGVLLINCQQFREKKVLEQFVELLHVYNFVVTQDEDYLNLICKDHVLWLDQTWNVEVFGAIPYLENEFHILHYIMASKPWHYDDCRFAEYFWKYAKRTAAYDEIRKERAAYTEEERERDRISCEHLLETAKCEIARKDNYLNLRNAGKLKAHDRLVVLDKIARLEREGRFDVDVEEDPPTRELKPEEIDYLRKKLSSKIKTTVTFRAARLFLNTILDDKKLIIKDIKGIEHFRNLDSGAIITCNHFNAFDSFALQVAYEASGHRKRKLYRVIREGNYTNFPGFYGMLMRNCNTFPLSSNLQTMKKFVKSMETVLAEGHFMLFYPEQSMWWNYRKPKPLKNGAYKFAAMNNVPVLPCFITMQDSDILGEDGFYIQEYTIHINAPIYPAADKTKQENAERMRQENFALWKQIYEETYCEPLSYACDN